MITHIVLYGFPPEFDEFLQNEFCKAFSEATAECGISQSLALGTHVRLPIDDHVPDGGLYSMIARWDFDSVDALREFSEHLAIRRFVRAHARPAGVRVAFINYDHSATCYAK